MMEKDQIEEMAIGLEEEFALCGTLSSCGTKRCSQCFSKYLYEQGYRKLPDGATVLLVGENNQALDEKTIEYFVKHNEQIRKETAEKILDLLVPDCKACDENWHSGCLCLRATLAEKIAKQFGVEVVEMTEQKQIEEMAVIGCVRNPQAHTAEECAKCEFKEGQCNAYRHAKPLYDTGYRKTFTSDLASDTQKAFKEGYEKGCETCEQSWDDGYNDGYESGKEDGMKEFAEKLKAKYGKSCSEYYPMLIEMTSDDIDELLKECLND